MAVIKSGDSTDELKIDSTAKAARTTLYDASGTVLGTETNPIKIKNNIGGTKIGVFSAATWRTLGTAATPQYLATIENPTSSGIIIAVKRIITLVDPTAALATVAPSIKLSRPASLPTDGTVIDSVKWDTDSVAADAIVRGGTASDGGGATAITVTADTPMWTVQSIRGHTVVGFTPGTTLELIPQGWNDVVILREGESLLVSTITASAATTFFNVNIYWEEYTE